MKYLTLSLVILQFCVSTEAICTGTQACLHDGQWDSNQCRCNCMPSYSGTYCELANCSTDPAACGIQLFPYQCVVNTIKNYCPRMCNARSCTCANRIDQCLNGGTFQSNNCSCTCPPSFSGTVCETIGTCRSLNCQNSGVLDNNKCACNCFASYTGITCQNLNCNVSDASYCVNFNNKREHSSNIIVILHFLVK